jgi:ABC-type oligopeptide transport system substrate-binding subunit
MLKRALDLLGPAGFDLRGSTLIPLFHLPEQWVARWTRIGRPKAISLYGYLPETWWSASNYC